MFRWQEFAPGQWRGVDGEVASIVAVHADRLKVSSTGKEEDFRRFLRLDEPLDLAGHLSSLDSTFLSELTGFRLLRPSNPVEALFCFLCTANNHLIRITSMVRWLESQGDPMPTIGEWKPRQFPHLEQIAGLSEAELRGAGFGYRAATIPLAAQTILARGGLEWLEELATMPHLEARAQLMEIKGIGPKLADCIALYALHQTEAVPVDTHLWQGACRLYFPEWAEQSLTASRYMAIGEEFRRRFGMWAGHAHLYVYYGNMLRGRTRQEVK